MAIEIQFLGAVGTVTGSQFLVSIGQRRILIDCGMFQGSPEEIARNRIPFAFRPDELDALLLTHAHLDHCGRSPALVKAGYRGPIHATSGTLDLAGIVLRDSAKLQQEAAERWQRRHARQQPVEEAARAEPDEEAGVETEQPLPERMRKATPEARAETREAIYGPDDVEQTVRQFQPVDYESLLSVTDGVQAVFHDAGHILGSAIIELRLTDGAEQRTVVFSGDLGRGHTPILRDPTPITHADYVLVESTYGNREHAPQEQAVDELVQAIGEVADDAGVLLVPSFAIGRTQELVWMLDELVRQGRIPRLPLYLDSPMASRASDVYLRHPEDYDEETGALLRSGDSPLEYPGETYTNSVEQSKAIRRAKRPIMVVASSGMLTGGRIVHHLKDFLPDPTCTLLFIGYQGEGTLGRHIQSGGKTARLDGEEYEVRCRVRSISGFSAHADEHELTAWLGHFAAAGARGNGEPKQVFIVHGDPDAAAALATRVRDELGMRAHVPQYEERVTLT
jgi:metallo-beta-lactamase family protein